MRPDKLKILMAAAEISPFAKVGGLADVLFGLPKALSRLNCEVRLFMPKYPFISVKEYGLKKIKTDLKLKFLNKIVLVNLWQGSLPGSRVKVYFLESRDYFSGPEVYGNPKDKFIFFSEAIVQVLSKISFKPQVIHCHDQHTALIPLILKQRSIKIKTLLTIHNLSYQGQFDSALSSTLAWRVEKTPSLRVDMSDGDINPLVEGIINADLVNTVSPSYAREILTKEYGSGLEKILRANKKKLSGIINGIDTEIFNPQNDKLIFKNFSLVDYHLKKENKAALQKKLSLPVLDSEPLIALISRLVSQKGLDLINDQLIKKVEAQFVFLGEGDKKYENYLQGLEKKYPEKVKTLISFDLSLAQKLYAASDIFLMPSLFEPCGLGQMIAMRYGTVPLVRKTGGLTDTVTNKLGFSFLNYNFESLLQTIQKAVIMYSDKTKWQPLVRACLRADFSWREPAKEYLKLYQRLSK
jgi:starch synthase